MEAHLDECKDCCRLVAELARVFATASRSHDSVEPESAGHEETLLDEDIEQPEKKKGSRLEPGTRLGRYHILEPVGAGGMGVVYSAYDANLDRKVALKVLHEHGSTDSRAQHRLLREAQAMARLAHPNVITVHEVSTVEQQVFISMEFVDGGTLGTWLKREKPDLPRVLAMFRDIGRGLAAAHAVGLVHRDVKPDNMLIGTDERPRVTDFGLARPTDDDLEASGGSKGPSRISRPTDPGLNELVEQQPDGGTFTRTGAMVGTPAYMAPEQFRRQATTAATDQFSFCVALHEAVYGERPFAGRALPELAANVLNASIVEPERDIGVPRWLRQVLRRGLSLSPEDRWPSMEELVARLEPSPPHARRRVIAAGVAGLAIAVVGTVASQRLSASTDPCDRGERAMDELWAQGARDQVQQALSQGSTEYAHDTAQLAIPRIDRYVAEWTASHRTTCEGYQRGELSDEALDLRGACLDERRRELNALLEVLGQADSAIRRHAVEAIDGLPPLRPCEDMKVLRARVLPPSDPRVHSRVQQLKRDLARARALQHAGQYEAGFVVANQATQSARSVGYAPILAHALSSRAALQRLKGQYEQATNDLRESWQVALGAGNDTLAAEAIVELIEVMGFYLQQFDQAAVRIDDARAMIDRVRRYDAPGADHLEGLLAFARGQIELRHHNYDAAIELFHLALERAETRAGTDGLAITPALNATASALLAKDRWDDALQTYQRVLDIRTTHLGPGHPQTGHSLNNVGLALKQLGRYEESIDHFERARAVITATLGAGHPSFQMVDINLAELHFGARNYSDANARYDLHFSGAKAEQVTADHVLRRYTHYAVSLSRSGRYKDARAILKIVRSRAVALDKPLVVLNMSGELAYIDVAQGEPSAALARLDEAMPDPIPRRPLEAEIAVIRGLALLARDEPGDRERTAALLPEIQAHYDHQRGNNRDELERLVEAVATMQGPTVDPPPASP